MNHDYSALMEDPVVEGHMQKRENERKARNMAQRAKTFRNLSYVGNSKAAANQVRNPAFLGKYDEYLYGNNPRTQENRHKYTQYAPQQGSISTFSEQEIRSALSEPFIRKEFAKYILMDLVNLVNGKDLNKLFKLYKLMLYIAFTPETELDPIMQLLEEPEKAEKSQTAAGNVMVGLVNELLNFIKTKSSKDLISYYGHYMDEKRTSSGQHKLQMAELMKFWYDDMKNGNATNAVATATSTSASQNGGKRRNTRRKVLHRKPTRRHKRHGGAAAQFTHSYTFRVTLMNEVGLPVPMTNQLAELVRSHFQVVKTEAAQGQFTHFQFQHVGGDQFQVFFTDKYHNLPVGVQPNCEGIVYLEPAMKTLMINPNLVYTIQTHCEEPINNANVNMHA